MISVRDDNAIVSSNDYRLVETANRSKSIGTFLTVTPATQPIFNVIITNFEEIHEPNNLDHLDLHIAASPSPIIRKRQRFASNTSHSLDDLQDQEISPLLSNDDQLNGSHNPFESKFKNDTSGNDGGEPTEDNKLLEPMSSNNARKHRDSLVQTHDSIVDHTG